MTTILVVDDELDIEPLLLSRFRRQIRQEQYSFLFAHNGREALTMLRDNTDIDLLLLDINMPGMDGLTLLGELAAVNPTLRAVMVSAYGDIDNIRTAMNRGAFDFVMKPINFSDLELTIEKTYLHVSQLRESHQLKIIDELKTRFFDNITHEFRTPLTLILSPVEQLLAKSEVDPTLLKRHLLTIDRNARQLLRLINQLLDLAKLESGNLVLMPGPGNLSEFIGQLVQGFGPVADARGLSLIYQHELPGYFDFDAEKIEQVVYNLVANALKFTVEGSITVTLTAGLSMNNEASTGVRLTVADTGAGIAADKLPYIFNRFYQASPEFNHPGLARTGQIEPGTGIGLALVKELTGLMAGTVTVRSSVSSAPNGPSATPSGTTFTVDLPLQRVSTSDHLPTWPTYQSAEFGLPLVNEPISQSEHYHDAAHGSMVANHSDDSERPMVLVVEDNDELRTFVAEELASRYRVLTANNGADAWHLVQDQLPDVVVSDVMMPVMDGYELTQLLKSTPATDHIAVVLLTARSAQHNRIQGLTIGADDYLAKPFHADELHLRLRNLLNRQQKLREYYRQELIKPDGPVLAESVSVSDKFLRQIYATIEANLHDSSLSVDGLADALAVSRKTLYRKLHSITQLSPNELIRQYRLRKGYDLLKAGNNVSETAYLVGFESATYFGKCFKEAYGMAPSEIQGRHRA